MMRMTLGCEKAGKAVSANATVTNTAKRRLVIRVIDRLFIKVLLQRFNL